jgi:hypothetical protein
MIGPGLLGAPAFILSLAALFWNPSLARPSLCAPSALRGTSGGETMTTPGGAGTLCKPTDNFLRARRIGFYHGVGAPTSGPSICPSPMLQGQPAPTFVDNGGRHPRVPRSPSVLVSKHTPSVNKSSIRARKKYPKWGMRSGSPR